MAFQQVRQILAHVQRLRSKVLSLVEREVAETHDEMLAGYLTQANLHDLYMQRCLQGQVKKAPKAVLDTWIQYPGLAPIEREVEQLVEPDEHQSTASEVTERVLALDHRILDLYNAAKAQSRSRRVQEFFDDMILMEEQKARAKAWGRTELSDLETT